MMEREESNSLTDLTSNFRHEQFEGEMKLRLAVPFDAWGPIGRGGSITTEARAHLSRLAETGNGDMARYTRVRRMSRPTSCPDPMRDLWFRR